MCMCGHLRNTAYHHPPGPHPLLTRCMKVRPVMASAREPASQYSSTSAMAAPAAMMTCTALLVIHSAVASC